MIYFYEVLVIVGITCFHIIPYHFLLNSSPNFISNDFYYIISSGHAAYICDAQQSVIEIIVLFIQILQVITSYLSLSMKTILNDHINTVEVKNKTACCQFYTPIYLLI